MSIANEYIDMGLRVSDVANILHRRRCSFYKSKSSEGHSMRRGRKNSSFTLRKDSDETIIVDNSFIVNEIEVFLSKEFVCYGYKKMSKQLNRLGYIVNGKKVMRLMSENNLLNHSYNRRRPVTRVVQSVVDVSSNDQVWEFDIKYVWIHGESRNLYLMAMIDCYSREIVGHYIGYHCSDRDVKETMMIAFDKRGLESVSGIRMRSNNGT